MAQSEEAQNYPMVVSAAEGMDPYHGSDAPEAIQPASPGPPAYGSAPGDRSTMPVKYAGAVAASQPVKIEPDADAFRQSQHAPINISGQRPPSLFQRHRKAFIIGGAITGVAVILAAVLGGVLGSRAANKGNGDNSLAAQSGRIPSTKGAFNGTGLTTYSTNTSASASLTDDVNYLIYQDFTGLVKRLTWTYDNKTQKITTQSSNTLVKDATNNTGLRVAVYPSLDFNFFEFHLLYTNKQGYLADAWNNNTEPNDPWYAGNLSSQVKFKTAPANMQRATLHTNPAVDPRDILRANFSRVWSGGDDGQVHMLNLNLNTNVWGTDIVPLPNSYAYGGMSDTLGQSSTSANTTLYSTLQDGTIQQRVIIDGDVVTNKTFFPEGRLQDPVNSNVKAAPNSTLWFGLGAPDPDNNDGYIPLLSYVTSDNKEVVSEDVDLANITPQSVPAPSSNWPTFAITPGSDLTYLYQGNDSDQFLVFYQAEGDDISWWMAWENGTEIASGKMDLLT